MADEFREEAFRGGFRVALLHRGPAAGDERRLQEIVERQQPGTQPVVNVVIVIGDIVGDRRDLRFEARPEAEIERKLRVGLRQRPARRSDRAIMLGEPFQRLPAEIQSVEPG
jgi:hypothetical protein